MFFDDDLDVPFTENPEPVYEELAILVDPEGKVPPKLGYVPGATTSTGSGSACTSVEPTPAVQCVPSHDLRLEGAVGVPLDPNEQVLPDQENGA